VDELTVTVSEPGGQEEVSLSVSTSTRVRDVAAMAVSSLGLPADVDWDVRDDVSSRLLSEDQEMGDIAKDRREEVRVTMQPDAGLGGK